MILKIKANTLKGVLTHIGIVVGLFVLLSFVVFYKVLPWMTNHGSIVTVPDLNGMDLGRAIQYLKKVELRYEVGDSAYDSKVSPLKVLEQFPKPLAKVKTGRIITLTLNSKNPATVAYPDIRGSTFDFAQAQLVALDLKLGTIEYRLNIAHNAILESRLNGIEITEGQRIPKGSKIDLIIGRLEDEFALPDFSGKPLDEVEAYLLGLNLKIKDRHAVLDDEKAPNSIQKQEPQPGVKVRQGDGVELWIYNLETKSRI